MTTKELLEDPTYRRVAQQYLGAGRLALEMGITSPADRRKIAEAVLYLDEVRLNGGKHEEAAAAVGYSQAQIPKRNLRHELALSGLEDSSILQMMCRPNPRRAIDLAREKGWSIRRVYALLRADEKKGLVKKARRPADAPRGRGQYWLGTYNENHVNTPQTHQKRVERANHVDKVLAFAKHSQRIVVEMRPSEFAALRRSIDPAGTTSKAKCRLPWLEAAAAAEGRVVARGEPFTGYNAGVVMIMGAGRHDTLQEAKNAFAERYVSARDAILKTTKFFAGPGEWAWFMNELAPRMVGETPQFLLRAAKTRKTGADKDPVTKYTVWLAWGRVEDGGGS